MMKFFVIIRQLIFLLGILHKYIYIYILDEVPSVAWVLNGFSVDAVYPILLLYPPETPVPSLSCRNLLLGSLLCPPAMLILIGFNM